MSTGLSSARLARLNEMMAGYVERGEVPGLAWVVARHGEAHIGTAGWLDDRGGRPVERNSIFRISSMTKPVTAVGALILIEECRLRLDDPVDELLPELADRRVLSRPDAALDDTVPATRPITVRDVLTFRLGYGMDFSSNGPQPVLAAMAELELGSGAPTPGRLPEADEWMRRLGSLPLARQPGEWWLYHTGAEVLGVLVARAAGRPLPEFLSERLFEPLGMDDTGFSVASADRDRFGSCFGTDPQTGARDVYDPPDGQWSRPPAFAGGGDGLVSTLDDYLAFAEMLRAGGVHRSTRILSRASIDAMTTNQLTPEQTSAFDLSGDLGWGFGVGVQLRRSGLTRSIGSYGWEGGLGTSWANDPAEDLIGILMTNQMWSSPTPPPVREDFWSCVYAAIDD